jgi:hypothetical protein
VIFILRVELKQLRDALALRSKNWGSLAGPVDQMKKLESRK